jgi:hypothetical protein
MNRDELPTLSSAGLSHMSSANLELEAAITTPMVDLEDEQWDLIIANETVPDEVQDHQMCKRYFQLAKRDVEHCAMYNEQPVGPPLTEAERLELRDLYHTTGADMSLV